MSLGEPLRGPQDGLVETPDDKPCTSLSQNQISLDLPQRHAK